MLKKWFNKTFIAQTPITPLVTFRIVFGVMMMIGTARFMALGWVTDHYVNPQFHFKYYGFGWVQSMGESGLIAIHILLLTASLFVVFGLFYRLSAIMVFVTFTYLELIDLTYYLNHYYFVSIIALLMIFVPANRYLSLDVLRKPTLHCANVPAWCVNIFKLQLAIVYIFAGLIKINYDWLINALPLKIWLPANDKLFLIGPIFTYKITPYIFSWVGMLYDCTIIIWLLWPKTRWAAYISVIVFHALTGILFQIGVFPVVMIGATLLFFSPQWHQKVLWALARFIQPKQLQIISKFQNTFYQLPRLQKHFFAFVLPIYFVFQLLFPWRFLLYPGNMYWTEQGYRFGWRVMLMEKAGTATFYITDSKTGKKGEVYNSEFLNAHQEKQMAMQPDMILQYAHFLGNYYQKQGIKNPKVTAEIYVTLNAQPSKLYIDSTLNLMTIKDGWADKNWIKKYH